MDEQGPVVDAFCSQIEAARADGHFVPFYYTVPDGHNPAGFSFSDARRTQILEAARELGVLIVEDAPYVYISYADDADRPRPFLAMAPEQTVHLFTGSKIGFPGPRIGFLYSEADLAISNGETVSLSELALVESSADILFHNPYAFRGFEALMHDENFVERGTFWGLAEGKLAVYREMREIMMDGLQAGLGAYPDDFTWTIPSAGFFTVFTFKKADVRTDDDFINKLVAEYGVVAIPMYDFYPEDARQRDPNAGYDQLRLSFCFSESTGAQRVKDLTEAVAAFCDAAKNEAGLDLD